MVDADTLIGEELERLAPREPSPPDWPDVLRRARRPHRRLAPLALAAALVVAVVAAPTFALSPSVRGFFGLGHPPFLMRAVPVLSTPAGHGLVLRLWASPVPFARCRFVVVSRAGARRAGGGVCKTGKGRIRRLTTPISYELGLVRHANPARLQLPATIDGFVQPRLHATRVELRWNGGSQRLAFRRGWFLGVPRGLPDPPARNLPYSIVAYDARGNVVAQLRIPRGALYLPR